MTKAMLITRDEADWILATFEASREDITERLRKRLHRLAPKIAAERDVEVIKALLKKETDRAIVELTQLQKSLTDPTEH